jgi:hypothetical protein
MHLRTGDCALPATVALGQVDHHDPLTAGDAATGLLIGDRWQDWQGLPILKLHQVVIVGHHWHGLA